MKSQRILMLFVIIASVTVVRYGLTKQTTENLPRNSSTAISKSWVSATPPPGTPFPDLQLWCYPDYIVCVWLYQDNIAGVQIGYPIAQIGEAAFDFTTQGFLKWSVSSTELWVTSQYFLSPDVLKGEATLQPSQYADQSIAPNVILKQGAVWVQGFNGDLLQIPSTTSAIKQNTLFTTQGCQIGKGRHRLYNLTRTGPDCKANKILKWFPITHDGELTATGLFLLAKVALVPGQRDWFERPPSIGLRVLIPQAPRCLYKLADEYSVTSTHIYYVTKPNTILCPLIIL